MANKYPLVLDGTSIEELQSGDNIIGLTVDVSSGVTGLGTNVATALGVNVGSSGAVVTNGGALGTPSSGTLSS